MVGSFSLLILTTSYSKERAIEIKNLTKLTKLPGIALSTSYLQNRVIYYEDYSNKLYPQMQKYHKMDYVYVP